MLRLRKLIFRKHADDDLDEEIQQHMAERTAALIEQGRNPEEAAREARRSFGNITLARERSVEVWQWRWLENLWADLRFALHQLRKSPGYTLTAILTLAIGIGANAAIFTLVDDVMLRSLPVSHPNELVQIGYRSPATPEFIGGQSFRTFDHLRQYTHGLGDLSGWMDQMVSVPDDQGTLRSIASSLVTGNGLSVLGLQPFIGRLLTAADDIPGGPEGGWPVVLDYGFWQSNYHGDPAVLGKHIVISGQPVVVVGVLPSDFHGIFIGVTTQVYLPSHFISTIAPTPDQDPYIHPEMFQMLAFGRLRPGVSLATLNAELAAASPSFIHALVPANVLANPLFRQATLTARSASRGMSFLDQPVPAAAACCCRASCSWFCCSAASILADCKPRACRHASMSSPCAPPWARRAAASCSSASPNRCCLPSSARCWPPRSPGLAPQRWEHFSPRPVPADATLLRPDVRVLALTSALALAHHTALRPCARPARQPHLVRNPAQDARHQSPHQHAAPAHLYSRAVRAGAGPGTGRRPLQPDASAPAQRLRRLSMPRT